MNVTGATMPGYRVNEYLLVLSPHEELRNKIIQVRQQFEQAYQTKTNGRPHVPLVNFVQYELMEERLKNRLHLIAMGHYPFKVELKDYGSFPTHTIFINVTTKAPVQELVKTIRTTAQKLMKLNDENKPHFLSEPHINIAQKLKPWQYEKGWLEYSHRQFTGRFIADGMLLLKRKAGEQHYQIVQRFAFENLPVSIKQGELFG
jgi:2'-5' RNA ligase